jgi:hypothetical protein
MDDDGNVNVPVFPGTDNRQPRKRRVLNVLNFDNFDSRFESHRRFSNISRLLGHLINPLSENLTNGSGPPYGQVRQLHVTSWGGVCLSPSN